MPVCPKCHGKKTLTITVNTPTEPLQETVELSCVWCDKTGEVTEQQLASIEGEDAMWCRCGNPSGDVRYVADGESVAISKHHWCCVDCDKIVQIG